MSYGFTNITLAHLEAMVQRVYNTFPDFVTESLLSARWIIEDYGIDHWNKFYTELTGNEPTKSPTKGGSETQNKFEENLKKI
jgi:hypothetical protein